MKLMHNFNTRKRRKREWSRRGNLKVAKAESLPKILTDTKPQVSEAQRMPSNINTNQTNK